MRYTFVAMVAACLCPFSGYAGPQMAEFEIDGTHHTLAPLRDGEVAFFDRTYTWESVPPQFTNGWSFTRMRPGEDSKRKTDLRIKKAGLVYVAVQSLAVDEMKKRGWSPLEGVTFNYTDKHHATVVVMSKKYLGLQRDRLPHFRFVGTVVLVPPKMNE